MELTEEQVEALQAYLDTTGDDHVYQGLLDPLNIILLHTECRPGIEISATVPSDNLSSRTPHAALASDPHQPILEAFPFATDTRVHVPSPSDEDEVTVTHMLARNHDRIEHILNHPDHKQARAVGRFLGYPPQAIDRFISGAGIDEWQSFLSTRTLTTEEVNSLSLVSYVPVPSESGFRRAVARGRRYEAAINRVLDTHHLPRLEERVEKARQTTVQPITPES